LLTASEAAATQGAHPNSETPGSDKLFVFSPVFHEEIRQREAKAVVDRAKAHAYKDTAAVDTTGPDADPEDATAVNFKAALRDARGILFVTTHGAQDLLLVELRAGQDDCRDRVNAYMRAGTFAEGELVCREFATPGGDAWGIGITGAAIKKYFKDSETIVHLDACESWSLRDDLEAARDFFGHEGCPEAARAAVATETLWGRLHGEVDNGEKRPTTVAGAELPAGLKHQHRANTLDTVLSPAVKQHVPAKDAAFVVPTVTDGTVIFDTKMDTTVDPASVIKVTGCDAKIKNPMWSRSKYALDFALELNTPGEATLTVQQAQARAERDFKNNLDGNQIPEGKDHIGPNRDDFVWKVKCVQGEVDEFPSSLARLTLVTPRGTETVELRGPTTVHVFVGPQGQAQDTDGDGRDQVQTEIVSMELRGSSSLGPVLVRLRNPNKHPNQRSTGEIEETANTQTGRLDLPPFAPAGTAESFFDVFVEVVVGNQVFHNDKPKRLTGRITHKPPKEGDTYESPDVIELLDENERPTGFRLGRAIHVPKPPIEVDQLPNSLARLTLVTPRGTETVELSGPTTVNVFIGPQGQAQDSDGNGRDDVATELVALDLRGNSSLGPVQVRLRPSHKHPNQRSTGRIEEVVNLTPGTLDIPPFRPIGSATSFFDVFVEIAVAGQVLHNDKPKRLTGIIRNKPPKEGDTYESPEIIELLDENERLTGYRLGRAIHIPNPEERRRAADLSIRKADAPDPVAPGQLLTYTLVITNGGPSPATGVTLVDTLPAGVSFASASPGCTPAAGSVACHIGTLGPGASAIIRIIVAVLPTAPERITNTVRVSGNEPDPNPLNNVAAATTTVLREARAADLSIRKTDTPDPVIAGTQLSYLLSVTNHGPSLATGVTLTDTLPLGVTFISATMGCIHAGGVVTCQLGNLSVGASRAVTILVHVLPTAPSTIVNTASVKANEPDPNPANNTATATTTVTRGGLFSLPSVFLALVALLHERAPARSQGTHPE
jgi:uncharacterized repeat protein (TIGR01451 family)